MKEKLIWQFSQLCWMVPRWSRVMSSSISTLGEGLPCHITNNEVVEIANVVLSSCFKNKHTFTKKEKKRTMPWIYNIIWVHEHFSFKVCFDWGSKHCIKERRRGCRCNWDATIKIFRETLENISSIPPSWNIKDTGRS